MKLYLLLGHFGIHGLNVSGIKLRHRVERLIRGFEYPPNTLWGQGFEYIWSSSELRHIKCYQGIRLLAKIQDGCAIIIGADEKGNISLWCTNRRRNIWRRSRSGTDRPERRVAQITPTGTKAAECRPGAEGEPESPPERLESPFERG
jgi:hypothetical protein